MNMSQPFTHIGEQPARFNAVKLQEEIEPLEVSQSQDPTQVPTESQWRRVLGVILVEGQIRYLVDRGE